MGWVGWGGVTAFIKEQRIGIEKNGGIKLGNGIAYQMQEMS